MRLLSQHFSVYLKLIISLCLVLFVLGCSDSQQRVSKPPVVFESGDECHVCGMIIVRMPGPKGQAADTRSPQMKKFCSTFDMISWYLQPENKPNVTDIYVHDMAQTDWDSPDDAKLIPAESAVYVLNSTKPAFMGKTIATFKTKADAELFIKEWSGNIVSFRELTIELILE